MPNSESNPTNFQLLNRLQFKYNFLETKENIKETQKLPEADTQYNNTIEWANRLFLPINHDP